MNYQINGQHKSHYRFGLWPQNIRGPHLEGLLLSRPVLSCPAVEAEDEAAFVGGRAPQSRTAGAPVPKLMMLRRVARVEFIEPLPKSPYTVDTQSRRPRTQC